MKKEKFLKAMKNVVISVEAENQILQKCLKLNNKKEKVVMSKRKIIMVAAAAAVFILGITVFAASGIISSWTSSSNSKPEYKSLPSAAKVIKDIGYEPILIEKFENGYTFKEGGVVNNSFDDDTGKSVEKFKSVSFTYSKDKDELMLSQDRYTSDIEDDGEMTEAYKGIDIYFTGYTNKVVPPDYKLTEEDEKAEASGELVFSYGSDEVSISEVRGVSWCKDNMHYNLLQIDGQLSKDELVNMAKEIIEYK